MFFRKLAVSTCAFALMLSCLTGSANAAPALDSNTPLIGQHEEVGGPKARPKGKVKKTPEQIKKERKAKRDAHLKAVAERKAQLKKLQAERKKAREAKKNGKKMGTPTTGTAR